MSRRKYILQVGIKTVLLNSEAQKMTRIWNSREETWRLFLCPISTLLKNVTRTGFLNPFDNQLYLGSNVFFLAGYMTTTQLFSLPFWQGPLSRRRTACSNDRIGSIEMRRVVKVCGTVLVAFKIHLHGRNDSRKLFRRARNYFSAKD